MSFVAGACRFGASLALGLVLSSLLAAASPSHAAATAVPSPTATAQQLRQAERSVDGRTATVTLPDVLAVLPGQRPIYRLHADLGAAPGRTAIYLPGLLSHARIEVNGRVVADALDSPPDRPPRGADRLRLVELPAGFVRAGVNDIELTLAGRQRTSLSTLWIGPYDELQRMRLHKLFWQVIGPTGAAAVILALSLAVLLLWARRPHETLYAYFGAGGVLWALHNWWTVLPDPLLGPPHLAIWWTSGYPFFVAPFVVFCVRLAQWRMPRFERAMAVGVVVGPLLLYAAEAVGVLEAALGYWRLLWIGAVAVGVFGVGRYALRRRDIHGTLLIGAGALAFAFALRDWLLDQRGTDNNPVFLTNYSGLLFFPLVAWMLIDGFVQTSRQLERLNADLERRVADKSAELLHALDQMRAAKDAAEAANRAKSSFLAAASHDLRQPVHALGLYTAALRAEHAGAGDAELVERMSASIGVLDTMFDALLDISRIDAGAVEVRRLPFALRPLLHRLADEFAPAAADRGLRLSVRVAPAADRLNASSDPLLVERIVRNLLGNAVKYTEAGGVLLACRLRGGAQPCWRIEVWDSGPGIPADEQERVFDEFYQLGNPQRDRSAGLGLGLSIVRRLARLLGHPLALHSRPGRGSRFVLELPASEQPAHAVAPAWQGGPVAGLGIAVIDDDAAVRDSMTVLLEHWGCDVVAGASSDEVLLAVGAQPARRLHAAVVDLQLRDGNGLDAIRALRAACGAALPAIVVSGASSPQRLAELEASGVEWLTKPVPAARLRGWISQVRIACHLRDEPLLSRREAQAQRSERALRTEA